ncbi:hypothetical protein KGF42_16765, partial [Clostridioides sp. ZZV15-6383]|uniref:hypothetical protein n=1 Tax=Clostridioides sp. ZZV15-6383 TaxID=2811498 RepID=UPI001D10B8CA|nr:hypothetical protein [Clostridioides sp. ZZV15-6383]
MNFDKKFYLIFKICYFDDYYASPASAVAEVIFGSMGGKIISVGILISVFGALNGFLLTGS